MVIAIVVVSVRSSWCSVYGTILMMMMIIIIIITIIMIMIMMMIITITIIIIITAIITISNQIPRLGIT